MLVPFFFIVPVNDYSWPEDTWGMMLGHNVSSVRDGMSHKDHRAELESVGFDYNPQRKVYAYNLVKAALLLYKDIYRVTWKYLLRLLLLLTSINGLS